MQNQARPMAEQDVIADDYHVVGRDEPDRIGAGTRILHGLQILVVAVIAVLSFAIFWVVGLLLNVF